MARTKVIRLCLSLAAIPALFALCALTIPKAAADVPAAPARPRAVADSVLTSTNPISVSAVPISPGSSPGEPVRNPSLAVGPDGTVHFAWWTEIDGSGGPCSDYVQAESFYAFIAPGTTHPQVKDAGLDSMSPRLSVGRDNTLFVAWLKCSGDTRQYHPAFDWAPSKSWLTGTTTFSAPFTYTVGRASPFDTADYVDEAPTQFIAQEHGQSRPHLAWERYDPAQGDAAHLLYYSRPVTDTLPITATRTPDPRLQTTTIPIADYTGLHPSLAVFERQGNTEAHVVWDAEITSGCSLREIAWSYADALPPTLTTAQPGGGSLWQPRRAISTNGDAQRKSKAPVSCDTFTRNAQFPVIATTPSDANPPDGLYVIWNEWTSGSQEYQIMSSRLDRTPAQGPSWTTPTAVVTATRTSVLPPALAVDKRGRQYVLWNDGFDKILLQASAPDGTWQATSPLQLNRGPSCAGSTIGSTLRVGDVGLAYDSAHEKLHAIWLARTATASLPNRLCYASVDLMPHKTFLPYIGEATTTRLGAPQVSGIKPLARP